VRNFIKRLLAIDQQNLKKGKISILNVLDSLLCSEDVSKNRATPDETILGVENKFL
jgi:hypothetical protein